MSFNLMAFAIGPYKKYECGYFRETIPVEFYCQTGSEALMEANL